MDFWLFLRSLSWIGSSGRLVGRISPCFVQILLSDTELSPVLNVYSVRFVCYSTIRNLALKLGFYVKFPPRAGSKGMETEIQVPTCQNHLNIVYMLSFFLSFS